MTVARKHLTRQQQFEISKFIEASGSKGADGYWVYNQGVTDQTIAEKFSAPLVPVQSLRIDLFGKMKLLPGKANIWDVVNDLESRGYL